MVPTEDALPPAWRPIVSACLREDPGERLQDLEGVLDELRRATDERVSIATALTAQGVSIQGASDRGPIRHDQDDRWAGWSTSDGARGVAAIADGMGGGVLGGLAAEWALEAVLDTVRDARIAPDVLPEVLRTALLETTRRVARFREALAIMEPMGTTLTALVWVGAELHLVQVGDSRAYRSSSGGELLQQSRDHVPTNQGPSRIPGGVTNVIDGGELVVDVTTVQAAPDGGELWLLATDGFWGPAHALGILPSPPESSGWRPETLLDIMRRGELDRLELLRDADNATVVVAALGLARTLSREAAS